MKTKEITIYNNYNWEDWEERAKENLELNDIEITDEAIIEEISMLQQWDWEDESYRLKKFFDGRQLIVTGVLGLWNGNFKGGKVFSNWKDACNSMIKDCDYINITDKNGELFVECSHHDGTNCFSVRILSERGRNLIEKWECDYEDERSKEEIYDFIMSNNLYSVRPWYAKYMC